MRRTPSPTRSRRCPRCQFEYAWDGRFCEHCHYPHAKRTNWDEFRQLARFPYAHPDPDPQTLRWFGCACVRQLGCLLPTATLPILTHLERADHRDAWRKAVVQANDVFTRLPDGPSLTRDAVRLVAILTQMLGGVAASDSAIVHLMEPLTPALLGATMQPSELRQMMFQFAHQVAQMQAHLTTPYQPDEAMEIPEFLMEIARRHGTPILNNLESYRRLHGNQYSQEQWEQAQRYSDSRRLVTELNEQRRRTRADVEALQCDLYRDLFGYPFVQVPFAPRWRTTDVVALAQSMTESGDYAAMPILGDALMDAGCEEGEIVAHCRRPLPHAHGCWLLRAILTEHA